MSGLLVRLKNRIHDTAGAAIALVALTMVVLLSCVALAVDVGMLVTARTEAAVLADATAMAGAGRLVEVQGDSAQAHDYAVAWGSTHNTVRGQNVQIENGDVTVIPDEWTVKVDVHRTIARGTGVQTFFARVFGVTEVDITAHAAAWAVESSTIGGAHEPTCPALPLALLDKYLESNGDPGWQDPEVVEGWTEEDNGTLVRLKGKPNAGEEPLPVTNEIDYCNETAQSSSWQCWWRHEDEDPNTPNVDEKILGEECTDPVSIGDVVFNAAGGKQSSVHGPFQSLIDMDPDLEWCPDCAGVDENGFDKGCVVESPSSTCYEGQSKRLRTVPVVDPASINGTGANTNANVTGFVGVFVERVAETYAGNEQVSGKMNVYLRLITEGGVGTADDDGENDPEAFVRTVQLIE